MLKILFYGLVENGVDLIYLTNLKLKILRHLLFILCIVVLKLNGFSQANASFTASDSLGCDSLEVVFTPAHIPVSDTFYIWDFGDESDKILLANSVTHWFYAGTFIIKLSVTDKKNKVLAESTDTIRVHPHPNANFFVADTFQLGKLKYRFRSGKAPSSVIPYRYVWTLDNPSNKDSIVDTLPNLKSFWDQQILQFSTEGTHTMYLNVTDDFGCEDNYSSTFIVSEKLVIPNVFTPNGDGKNDNFEVQTNGRSIYTLQIFSTTGQLVYKSESRSITWDGYNYNGQQMDPGTYYYLILSDGEVKTKQAGYLVLLREKK